MAGGSSNTHEMNLVTYLLYLSLKNELILFFFSLSHFVNVRPDQEAVHGVITKTSVIITAYALVFVCACVCNVGL